MKSFNKLFTEEQVIEVSEKILANTKEKIKEQLANVFYSETEGWLYEIYTNNRDKIEKELIAEITEKYVKEPTLYKFKDLRDKLWIEHKDEIVGALTDEAVKESIETALLIYTHRDYNFNWQWKDAIVQLIMSNWSQFQDDERINQGFRNEIEKLKFKISNLEGRLYDVLNVDEE